MRLETKAVILVLAVAVASLLLSIFIGHVISGTVSITSEYIPINHTHHIYISADDSAGNLTIRSYAGQSLEVIEIKRSILCPPNYLHYAASEAEGSLYLSIRSSEQFYWWPSWLCSISLVLLIPRSQFLELISINGTNGFVSLNGTKITAARIGLVNGMVYLDDMNISSLRISLVNGVALLMNSSSNDAAISIVNGVANLSLSGHYGKYSVSVINGVVNSIVPVNSSISISADNGKLIIETPTGIEKYAGVSLLYTEGLGSPSFTASVVNGVINVHEH
ncbi:hypothetical protein [Caldivirga maquilingensis]|uniref:Adhesin domain-containing protein n=1 Tax=Caldivirga maquilingensis (strain ATCC 700844 / DSM 13496 / JCM 10307 / IC-167) TaxID=397948 RepID=A8M995_CALMQ|nr:hypothetical protein [Caldivirga maquilingensis]ABW02314.1 hypothetical protein Cmaq_1490 [Caldivirga maquilingensis IC-167]